VKLKDIAARLDCVLSGEGDIDITGIVGIEEAANGHITFVSNPKYAARARTTTTIRIALALRIQL